MIAAKLSNHESSQGCEPNQQLCDVLPHKTPLSQLQRDHVPDLQKKLDAVDTGLKALRVSPMLSTLLERFWENVPSKRN